MGRLLSIWIYGLCTVLTVIETTATVQAQQADRVAETAMMAPLSASRGKTSVALPHPLSPSDAMRLRRILSLHASGSVVEAMREAEHLNVAWLAGTVLADRYLSDAYRPTTVELTAWLAQYGDQPSAGGIRALLDRVAPPINRPTSAVRSPGDKAGTDKAIARVRQLFTQNQDAEAISAAMPLLHSLPEGRDVSEALFIAGLAALRLDQSPVGQTFLQAAYTLARSDHLRAGAAFWMARAVRDTHGPTVALTWTRRAAQETDTFYAWIAHRQIGGSHECIAGGILGRADLDALLAEPAGRRALAWLQIGEKRRADQELRAVWYATQPDPGMARVLYLVAGAAQLPQLANDIRNDGVANRVAAERQPLEKLVPAQGFLVDPPLVYALVRRESNFLANARSGAGARGLMQIMPATAQATGTPGTDDPAILDDPGINLDVGQKYLLQLAEDKVVGGHLLSMLAAYEQGQYAARRWMPDMRDGGDPLMFLEAMPRQATRLYVEQTLTHAWRYAARFKVAAESLDALASGQYPALSKAKVKRPRFETSPPGCLPASR